MKRNQNQKSPDGNKPKENRYTGLVVNNKQE